MRYRTLSFIYICSCFTLGLCLTGCSMMGGKATQKTDDPNHAGEPQTNGSDELATDVKSDIEADDLNTRIQTHADQLLAAIERQQAQARKKHQDELLSQQHSLNTKDPLAQSPHVDQLASALDRNLIGKIENKHAAGEELPQVQWLNLAPAKVEIPEPIAKVEPPKTVVVEVVKPKTPIMTIANVQEDYSSTQVELASQQAVQIRASNQSPMLKALTLSNLSLSSNQNLVTAEDLKKLSPVELDQIRKMHSIVLKNIASHIKDKPNRNDYESAMDDQITKLFGPESIGIREVKFCRTVSGFGVYDPFESTTFMAGIEQPLIVYVELDHFNSLLDGSHYRVQLTQEVELYTDADGIRVWHLPRENIIDKSRNKRRDFFTVQLIHLPARLGVGKYRLKVRIHDVNGGGYDETTVPITLVASKSTTAKNEPRNTTATR